jgi:hypothetical protein
MYKEEEILKMLAEFAGDQSRQVLSDIYQKKTLARATVHRAFDEVMNKILYAIQSNPPRKRELGLLYNRALWIKNDIRWI